MWFTVSENEIQVARHSNVCQVWKSNEKTTAKQFFNDLCTLILGHLLPVRLFFLKSLSSCTERSEYKRKIRPFHVLFHAYCAQMQEVNQNVIVSPTISKDLPICFSFMSSFIWKLQCCVTKSRLRGNLMLVVVCIHRNDMNTHENAAKNIRIDLPISN